MTADEWGQRRTSFGVAATDYATGRPHYPDEALQWALPDGAVEVVDLGAGTGILTHDLLTSGRSVTAVEPLPDMRALIPEAARVLDGTAEAIPLPDSSVDAVVAGQAWHWFDVAAAVAEAHRVLRPGGTLAVFWNLLDTSDPLTGTVADLIGAEERTDRMVANSEPPFDVPACFTPAQRRLVRHVESYDVQRAVEFTLSRSQSILLDDAARATMLSRLRAALPDGSFRLHWCCEAWRARAK